MGTEFFLPDGNPSGQTDGNDRERDSHGRTKCLHRFSDIGRPNVVPARNTSHHLSCWRADHVPELIADTGEGGTEGRRRNFVEVAGYHSLQENNTQLLDLSGPNIRTHAP